MIPMSPLESLVARVRGEYGEMPGLTLTFPQACRLWQVDRLSCETVLEYLVNERFLYKTLNGAYVALPATVRRHATASLSDSATLPRSA